MAAATAAYFAIQDYAPSPKIRRADQYGGAGWIGSKAGSRGHFVQVDSNGYYDQAAAVSNAVSSTLDVAVLHSDVASTVAADSADALAVQVRFLTEGTEIELPLVNNSDTFVTVLNTRVGETLGLYRRTAGDYAADANGSGHLQVTGVNVTRGTVTGVIVDANRLR